MPVSEVLNMDCLEYMKEIKDNHFDIAICDPPYGIEQITGKKAFSGQGKLKNRVFSKNADKFRDWDIAPTDEYFNELFRISKNQIIFGGNYFKLPPCRCFIVWDKKQPFNNFSACEYAWSSFNMPAKLFSFDVRSYSKIHPTQKPIELYSYILQTFAKKGDIIFDSHLGSGSSRISAYKLGYDFYSCELDKEYFDSQEKRFKEECFGEYMLSNGAILKQTILDI